MGGEGEGKEKKHTGPRHGRLVTANSALLIYSTITAAADSFGSSPQPTERTRERNGLK